MQLNDMWRDGKTDVIEPTPEAIASWSDYIARGLNGTVWVGGCQSWYLDASGQPTIFPYNWDEFLRVTETPEPSELVMSCAKGNAA